MFQNSKSGSQFKSEKPRKQAAFRFRLSALNILQIIHFGKLPNPGEITFGSCGAMLNFAQ
jgi:hypothetical protein